MFDRFNHRDTEARLKNTASCSYPCLRVSVVNSFRSGQQLERARALAGLGAVVNVELLVDVAHVALDRARGDEELVGDLLVREPPRYVLQDFQLALAQGVLRVPPRQRLRFGPRGLRGLDGDDGPARLAELEDVAQKRRP